MNKMERLVSSNFYLLLNQISDQNFESEYVFSVFKNEIPKIAPKYGIKLIKAKIYEPIKRSSDMNVTEVEICNLADGEETNNIISEFPIVNGGKVIVTSGISKDNNWTKELEEDVYIISKMIFLLVGRAKTMATLSNLMFFDQMTGISNETGLTRYMGSETGNFVLE